MQQVHSYNSLSQYINRLGLDPAITDMIADALGLPEDQWIGGSVWEQVYPVHVHYYRGPSTVLAIHVSRYGRECSYTLINTGTLSTIRCDTLVDRLPHGSGIDADWGFDILANGKIQATNSYHAMRDGMYWGWLDFSAILAIDPEFGTVHLSRLMFHEDYIPDWLGGRQMMLDYLWQTFDYRLTN